MLTRGSTIQCPRCGHKGKPKVKGESPALFSFLPWVGPAFAAKDLAMAELVCRKCDLPLTESRAKKAVTFAGAGIRGIEDLLSRPRAVDKSELKCTQCGSALAGQALFCEQCGKRQR